MDPPGHSRESIFCVFLAFIASAHLLHSLLFPLIICDSAAPFAYPGYTKWNCYPRPSYASNKAGQYAYPDGTSKQTTFLLSEAFVLTKTL